MTRRALVLTVLATFFATGAQGAILQFQANLAGANENPPVPSAGIGFAVVDYDSVAQTLQVTVDFASLTGVTTVAHIHCCVDPPENVGVATFPQTFPGFPVGVQAGSYVGSWSLALTTSYTAAFLDNFGGGTAAGAEEALLAGMLSGRAYVNIHTDFRPGGEIRGFLAPVPEPGSLSLLGIGVASLVAARRRRRAARS